MKKLKVLILLIVAISGCMVVLRPQTTSAEFNSNRIIDDAIFNNVNSMNAGQIDAFLNTFPSSCISTNRGFSATDPIGYSPGGGYQFGGNVSAGTIIAHAAQAYDMNPQVLLATLQKEQSLVNGNAGCSVLRYVGAMGYGCPDSGTTHDYTGGNFYTTNGTTVTTVSGTCVNSLTKAGFSQQVIRGAWLLKFGQQRSLGNIGWAIIRGNWNNSDDPQSCYGGPMTQGNFQICPSGPTTYYDGYRTIDGTPVHMDTGATAAFYWYTPHFHGNQNFVTIFEQSFGFGSTRNPFFAAEYHSQSSYPVINSGAGRSVYFQFKNIGNSFWKDDFSSFPGYGPVHLATTFPMNRGSGFHAENWINAARPTGSFSAVFESDGVTPAVEQHTVQPGQIARFAFTMYANPGVPPGVYREYFQPILEGAPNGMYNMGGWAYLDVGVHQPYYRASYHSQSAYPTIARGSSANVLFKLKNTGNDPWFGDTAVPAGQRPTHLATSWPINRSSIFSAGWPNVNRPKVNFSKVYEANGVTLASAQNTVWPGQVAEFEFPITVPVSTAPGFYREDFEPIVEGAPGYDWSMREGIWMGINVN